MKKLLLLLPAFCFTYILFAQQPTTLHSAQTIPVKLVSVSPFLSAVAETPLPPPDAKRVIHDNESLTRPFTDKGNAVPDEALQKEYSTAANALSSSTILSNWAGLTANVEPSDNTLAVGPNHVMQMTNNGTSTYIRIWNKSGSVLVNNKLVKSITNINDYGDCNVLYDEGADRFLFVVLYSGSGKKLVVCVSKTADPTGAYYVYSFDTPNGFPDYPKIGVWGNSYFITTNSSSPTIFALNRAAMLAGNSLGTVQMFKLSSLPKIGFQSAAPVTQTGATAPPANSPALVMRVADSAWGSSVGSDHLEIFQLLIDWSNASNSTITGPVKLKTIAYNSSISTIPQKGSSTKLDALGNILMDKVQYRNLGNHESIVCSHVCNAGNKTGGVRWYELRKKGTGVWKIYQQGTYAQGADNRFMSSITINGNGAIALGYNISSAAVYPGIRITGRNDGDALNNMTVPETIVQNGSHANGSNRYGDYNGMVTDPTDGSFWFTGNYNPTSNWATSVVHFTINTVAAGQQAAVAAANTAKATAGFIAQPNPASNEIKISFTGTDAAKLPLQIVDMNGKLVMQQIFTTAKGNNETTLNVQQLQNGYYFVRILNGKETLTQKVLIQH